MRSLKITHDHSRTKNYLPKVHNEPIRGLILLTSTSPIFQIFVPTANATGAYPCQDIIFIMSDMGEAIHFFIDCIHTAKMSYVQNINAINKKYVCLAELYECPWLEKFALLVVSSSLVGR